jgi:glutamate racemase
MIGVLDSGVGGLSIFRALIKSLPDVPVVYLADNKNFPFGQKPVEQVQELTRKMSSFLIKNYNVSLVVIACNTSTVASISFLREHFTVPFVGVVPVVKPACEQSKTKRVAILSTQLTANSVYQKDLINKYSNGAEVFSVGCSDLVDFVEKGELESQDLYKALKFYIDPLLVKNVDVIALGCTHFVFLREQIKKIVPSNVKILDSTEPVVAQTKRVYSTFKLNKEGERLTRVNGRYFRESNSGIFVILVGAKG